MGADSRARRERRLYTARRPLMQCKTHFRFAGSVRRGRVDDARLHALAPAVMVERQADRQMR